MSSFKQISLLLPQLIARITAFHIYICLATIIILTFLWAQLLYKPALQQDFKAHNGLLQIPDNVPLPINLNGEWRFYWNQLLKPDDIPHQQSFINQPAKWNSAAAGARLYPGSGFATYQLDITLPEMSYDLGLKLPRLYRAASVWINGTKVASVGVPGMTVDTEVPREELRIIPLPGQKTYSFAFRSQVFTMSTAASTNH